MPSRIESIAVRAIGAAASVPNRLGAPSRVLILILHRVLPEQDPLAPAMMYAQRFRSLMEAIALGFTPISLFDAVSALQRGTLPQRAVCVTFDDGYADNAEVAMPILRDLGIPATFFIATGYLNGGVMFNDKIAEAVRAAKGDRLALGELGLGEHDISTLDAKIAATSDIQEAIKSKPLVQRDQLVSSLLEVVKCAAPEHLMMSDEQVKMLVQGGMTVGGHTHRHPILRSLPLEEAREEILFGKQYLEALVQQPVDLFAYPNGRPGVDYDERHVTLLAEGGFKAAVSTAWGVADRDSSVFELPRFMPWERTPATFAARVARGLALGRVA